MYLAVKQRNIAYILGRWRQTPSLRSKFETLWVELTFFDVVENSIVCSRIMSRVDFPDLWVMAKFLDKMYNVGEMAETCVKSRRSTQTLISEGQYMMKWVEPAFENQKSQIGRTGDSSLGFHFFSMMHGCDYV